MKIHTEGDRGVALSPAGGEVPTVYVYRDIELDSGVKVCDVLVGVDEATGEVLTIPAQSTPKIKRARESAKDQSITARLPRELEDVLLLVAGHFRASTTKFAPALIRLYLAEATRDRRLAGRLLRLAGGRLANATRPSRITVRCSPQLAEGLSGLVTELEGASLSDLVRGAIVAAKEDVLDGRAGGRTDRLRAIATAV